MQREGRAFAVHFVSFGCSLTIRKKQGGSGCSNGRIHLGKKLHCSIEAAA